VGRQAEQLLRMRGIVTAFNRQDATAVVQQLGAGFVWSRGDGGLPLPREGFAANLHELFGAFPDATLSQVTYLALPPDTVLIEWVLEGTHLGDCHLQDSDVRIAATGRRVRVAGSDLVGFNQSGELVVDQARIDTASLLSQLGAVATADASAIRDLAERYTAAWCSENAVSVASFFCKDGMLSVNAAPAAVGRAAIAETAQGFMTAFPDLQVIMDGLLVQGDRAVYQWTLVGTSSGPGGRQVRISGYEVWRIGGDGLIAESRGHFDSGAYERQLR